MKPSYAFVCASCHLTWGVLIGILPAFFGFPPWTGPVLLMCWAAPKEFLYDIQDEGDTFLGSLTDFFWYVIGGGVAVGLIWLKG